MKKTILSLVAVLMACGAVMAGEWNAASNTNWSVDENWSGAHPRTRVQDEWIWLEGVNATGPNSPHVTATDASGGEGTLVVGNGGGAGQLDIDAGGHLSVRQVKVCRDGNTGGSSLLSLNAMNRELTVAYSVVGEGVDDTAILSTKGIIHAARIYLGGWNAGGTGNGTAQVNLLDGEV